MIHSVDALLVCFCHSRCCSIFLFAVDREIYINLGFVVTFKLVYQCATSIGNLELSHTCHLCKMRAILTQQIFGSLGLALFECGTRQFPYTADEGLVNLMQQVFPIVFFLVHDCFALPSF